jgi:4,5-DOPA dioxygenase extradiol
MAHSLLSLRKLSESLSDNKKEMPVLFIGHGSPMNGIENNPFSGKWSTLGRSLETPAAVLVVSAHWLTKGTKVTAMDFPRTIHDFGGFPKALFDVNYPAPGDPELAGQIKSMISKTQVDADHEWGLDHGAWTVVRNMYPDAKIPVLQLSIDYSKDLLYHYELAAELRKLRQKGVLIIGSGNMVHNLGMISLEKMNETNYGFDWAIKMNQTFKDLILKRDHDSLIKYQKLGREAGLAIPTPEHYIPLIYTLGLTTGKDEIDFFNDNAVGGSITMTSVQFAS